MSCFVIAEAGVNHNGSLDMALAMIDVAAEAGADAIKFQTFKADLVISPGTKKAEYQAAQTGEGDQLDMARGLELSESDHVALVQRCQDKGIEFMSTPFDAWALELLMQVGMRRIKIASGEITHRAFIERIAITGLPLVLSTGMATIDEVKSAIEWIKRARQAAGHHARLAEILTLLHCTSNYPAAYEDINLMAMQTIASETGIPVGYSDHSLGIEVPLAAVALGASIIEKHFTLDRAMPGPDHQASLDPRQLQSMVDGIRRVEQCLGDGRKFPRPSELPIRDLVRRSAFASRDLPAGTRLVEVDLCFLRPGVGIGPEREGAILGRMLRVPLRSGTMIQWEDLEL